MQSARIYLRRRSLLYSIHKWKYRLEPAVCNGALNPCMVIGLGTSSIRDSSRDDPIFRAVGTREEYREREYSDHLVDSEIRGISAERSSDE